MLVEHIEFQDRILATARKLSLISDDECFSASEVAVKLGITDHEVLCALARLEEKDWVVRFESDWSNPATGKTRWVAMEHANLTIGRRYEVLAIENDIYRILDDSDDPVLYDPSCFKIIDDSRPSFWICSTGEDGELYCEPPEWADICFFEKYHDGVESVRDEFWKVLRKYYPFTWSERRTAL